MKQNLSKIENNILAVDFISAVEKSKEDRQRCWWEHFAERERVKQRLIAYDGASSGDTWRGFIPDTGNNTCKGLWETHVCCV